MQLKIEPKPRGSYENRDRRYVAEYLAWAFPHDIKLINVRLGPAPLELRMRYPQLDVEAWAKVWEKTCDAIAVTPTALVLIEGELRRPVVAVGELLIYRHLILQTVDLARYWSLPIRTVLLTPIPDPTLDPVLSQLQIEPVYYDPPWALDYLRKVGRL